MTRRLPVLALLAAALLAPLAGTAGAQEGGTEREVQMYLHDSGSSQFGVLHMLPERINAEVGDTLKVTVFNQGAAPHNVVFCGDEPSAKSSCTEKWAFTPMIPANGTATLTVRLEEPGTYEFFCDVPGHKAGGMAGELVVQGEATRESPSLALLGTLGALAAVAFALGRR